MRRSVTLLAQGLLLAYFELTMLVPLGSWNDQPARHEGFSIGFIVLPLAIGLAQLLLLVATWRGVRWLIWIGVAADSAWLVSHIFGLWLPYVRGASPERMRMQWRVFGRTTKLLPTFGNHPAPDGMHIVLDALLLLTILATVALLRQRHSQLPAGRAGKGNFAASD